MEALYALLGVAATGLVLFLVKMFGGGKGKEVVAPDTAKSTAALETAAELLGRRAMVEAKADADKARVEEKLAIEDPAKRVEALAEELKDL
jgi:uncharacterized protein (DUF697 family)